jgi:DNA-binding transcriptional MerR regulator/methylmalonyl-CoA mutase cobalamin-binding subunit
MNGSHDMSGEQLDATPEQMWPMGAVTRRTGIGEHTLRAWERRFGFPQPVRLPSGHRRYTSDQVRQLMLIAAALGCGYRAGDVVPLPLARLEDLLRESGALDSERPDATPTHWLQAIMEAARRFDAQTVTSTLHNDALNLGVPRFLRERVAPLLVELGEAWTRGDIDIRHEHFVSEILEGALRSLRSPLEINARGRPVVLACPSNEHHGLGLHVAALTIAAGGRAVQVLGPHLPPEEIVQAALTVNAAAAGLSVSMYSANSASAQQIAAIRDGLPHRIRVWVGGAGAALLEDLPADVSVVASLDDLEHEIQHLPDVM